MIELINLSWILALLGALTIYFVPANKKATLATIAVVANSIVTGWLAILALTGQIVSFTFNGGGIMGDVIIRVDELSAWFILIINFTCITGVFYGSGYLKAYNNSAKKLSLHWILFVLFQLSMVWVCLIQNGFVFLIAWEIMSLSSMMLVIFDAHNPKTLKAGINYLVQMHISVVFLTIGFIWVYFQTGSFSLDAFTTYFGSNSNIWLFLVFFIGFGLKAGFIPLHSWLPHAHPAAPSHVSGVMSGVIVKLGIYGIFRVASYLKSDYLILGEIIITISILSGLYGILNAAVHRDFKKMLAYCTIENIGIIGVGIGIGLIGLGNNVPILYYLGFGGALLHVLNHSLFKSLLFYSAGSVYQQTHTRNMEKLGGLIKSMPRTAVLFLIGAVAIGGMPPFNGFISEFLIYSGLIKGIQLQDMTQIILMVLTLAGMSIIGGLSILTFTKTFGTIFLGNQRQPLAHKPHEVSSLMLIPQYVIVAVMLSVAVIPQFYLQIIGNILSGLTKSIVIPQPVEFVGYISIMQSISLYSVLLIGIIAFFWGIRALAIRGKSQVVGATWGCGYTAGTSKIQYTAKSFSKSLSKTFNFIVIERKQYEELQAGEIFPKEKKYTSHYHDFFEFRLIHVVTNRLIYSANYFKFIQNGRIQSYVLYGIIFIIAVFILTLFNIVL
ncbi:MAG: proton-conducting transporter membrane subunit [Paludibacter sp.]